MSLSVEPIMDHLRRHLNTDLIGEILRSLGMVEEQGLTRYTYILYPRLLNNHLNPAPPWTIRYGIIGPARTRKGSVATYITHYVSIVFSAFIVPLRKEQWRRRPPA